MATGRRASLGTSWHKRATTITGVFLVSALAAVACGGDGNGGGAAGEGDTTTLYVAETGDLQNLDPHTTSGDTTTLSTLDNIYGLPFRQELVETEGVDVPMADPTEWEPAIAESWEWNDDETVLTVHIREDISFSDGTPLDANAVYANYERIFEVDSTGALLIGMTGLDDISMIDLVDDYTLEFELPGPSALLMGSLGQFSGGSIVNPKVFEENSEDLGQEYLRTNVEASGAFDLAEWNPGSGWVLESNPEYWDEVGVDTVEVSIVEEASQRQALLRSGEVDIAYGIPLSDVEELSEAEGVELYVLPSLQIDYVFMNTQAEPFDNPEFRQAINYAIPYETILEESLFGLGEQLRSPLNPDMPTYSEEYWDYDTDYDRARELLEESGVGEVELTLTIDSSDPIQENTAQWIQQGLAEIGVGVSIDSRPSSAYHSAVQGLELDFALSTWTSTTQDPFYHYYWTLYADTTNRAHYDNEEVHALIEEWMNQPADDPGRIEASEQVQEIVVDDAPWVFLFERPAVAGVREGIDGYTWQPSLGVRYDLITKD